MYFKKLVLLFSVEAFKLEDAIHLLVLFNQYVVKHLPVDQLWEGKSIIADISSLLFDK